ncbi:fungal-specific transcription factor domain-containing protein [Penicillium maclennaniae]|uniref:fungal-specific transcription factor domain-containing protein n=1 Tax=Penicillium maclennaniae TaxID=1343394 RepID=UPI0025403B16|nr:fungal-specific transcription factor domain-containing protein [Penicillium maclennaniae]KAJ5676493.1 fungal-specific transcription factor domain-containing protein [Penicillium maclennaniae]
MGSKSMTVDMESTVLGLIDKAAAAFNCQSAPPGSSCTLQARFLENLLAQYRAAQSWPIAAPRPPTLVSENISSRDYFSHQAMAIPGATSTAPTSSQVPVLTTALNDTSAQIIAPKTTLPNSNVDSSPSNEVLETPQLSDERTDLLYQEEMWIDMVANAGFDLHDGIFYQVQ